VNERAVIVDRGYRSYTEERLGRRGAMRAIVKEGFRRVLGLRRKARRKLFPWALIAISTGIAFIFIGLHWVAGVALGPAAPDLPGYGEYFDLNSGIAIMFIAFAAPALLVPDRVEGVLNIYLSRPLRMVDYLLAKTGALATLVLAFYLVPEILLHLGLSVVSSEGFLSYTGANLDILWKVPVVALAYFAAHASLAVTAAALVPREGFAAGTFFGGLIIFNGVGELLTQLDIPGAKLASFLAVEQYPRVIRDWVFDIDTVDYLIERSGFDQWTAVPAIVGVVLLASAIVWARYRRLP
jgi:ABC-2 type transport system permease protein